MKTLEDFIREEFNTRLSQSGIYREDEYSVSKLIETSNKYNDSAKWREAGMLVYIASIRYEEYKESLK